MAGGLLLSRVQNAGLQSNLPNMGKARELKINDCGTIAFTDKNRPIEDLYKMLETYPLRKDYNHIESENGTLFGLRKGKYHRFLGNFEDYTFAFDIIVKVGSKYDKELTRLFKKNRRKYLHGR